MLAAYGDDLKARGANSYNARWPLKYLPAALLSKPVTLIDAHEWRKWRDSLIADLTPAGVNRVIGAICAACNLTASHTRASPTIGPGRSASRAFPTPTAPATSSCPTTRCESWSTPPIVAASASVCLSKCSRPLARGLRRRAASRSATFASTIPPSQNSRPRSGKGGGRLRVQRKAERSARRSPSAWRLIEDRGRGPACPRAVAVVCDDRGWGDDPSVNYRADMRIIVAEVGLDPHVVTAYAFRHSSICRQLLANVPVRVVASVHDTSVAQIEAHYSKYITEHSDQLSRRALLQLDTPPATTSSR